MIKSKSKSKKSISKSTFILLGIVSFVAVAALYIKRVMVSPKVALIAETSKQMCITNINSISFHEECGTPGTFKRAVYTCSNGSTAEKLAGGLNCITYSDVLKEAQNNCGQTCVAPSPTPTPTPTPTYSTKPSATPTASACGSSLSKWQFKESCGTNMYRYISFNCSGSTLDKVLGSPDTCKKESNWVTDARNTCMQTQCASPVPTVFVSAIPKIIPPPSIRPS
ncbi:MAG: hypothetical protein DPW11_04160, partial [bacterium]|nr:hypothetical protein [bacterium]